MTLNQFWPYLFELRPYHHYKSTNAETDAISRRIGARDGRIPYQNQKSGLSRSKLPGHREHDRSDCFQRR
jgi:hypothetical protein